jgi:hypothetical protein
MEQRISEEDDALLAILIEELRASGRPMSIDELVRVSGHLVDSIPSFLSWLCGGKILPRWIDSTFWFLIRRAENKTMQRTRGVLDAGVSSGRVSCTSGTYSATPQGLEWSIQFYRTLGEHALDDQESIFFSADICQAIVSAGRPLTDKELIVAIFPDNIDVSLLSPAHAEMQRAHRERLPSSLIRGLEEGTKLGWLIHSPAGWMVTEIGRDQGANYYRSFR